MAIAASIIKSPGKKFLDGVYDMTYNTQIKLGKNRKIADDRAKESVVEIEKAWSDFAEWSCKEEG